MADYIRIRFNTFALPALTNRNGEATGNWTDSGGNHTVAASDEQAHTGTKSLKITATSVGDFTSNYAKLLSANMPTFIVGRKYRFTFWSYMTDENSGVNETFKVKMGGVASDNFITRITPSANPQENTWVSREFVFTALSATTDFQIIITLAGVTTHLYIDDISVFEEYEDLNVLVEKGLTRAEKYSMWPEIVNKYIDGNSEPQYRAFIRSVNIRTVALTAAQLIAYLNWTLDNDRLVDYSIQSTTETDLILIPEVQQETQRYEDFRESPYLEVNFAEGTARTAWVS
jgi:hypothetical protein